MRFEVEEQSIRVMHCPPDARWPIRPISIALPARCHPIRIVNSGEKKAGPGGGFVHCRRVIFMARASLAMVKRGLGVVVALGIALFGPRGAGAFVWPSAAERAAHALASGDASARRNAAADLGEMPEAIAAPLLLRALGDSDVEVRLRAVKSAIRLRSAAAVTSVIPWLSDGEARVRLAACELIRYVPTPRAVAALGRVLSDPDAAVRLSAALAMGASGAGDAVGPLLGHLDDPSPSVRAEIAQALARIGDRRAAVPLVGRVGDSAPEVRRAVVRALGELGDPRASSALVLALRDTSAQVRVEALGALGRLRAQEAVVAIAPLLDDRAAPEVRAAALGALGRIGSELAVATLIKALATDDAGAQSSSVRDALESAGERATAPLLSVLESYGQPNIAAGAALVLGATQAKGAGPVVVRAMGQGSLGQREGLRALARLGDRSTLPAVLELLSDANPTVRHEAVVAAIALLDPAARDGRAVEPLVAALRDARPSAEEKELLLRALGRTGAARARDLLLPFVAAPALGLRLAAIDALGAMGPAGQDAALLSALDDPNAEVRMRAALALSLSGSEASVPQLLGRLTQSASDDRTAVGIALSGTLSRSGEASARLIEPALRGASDAVRDALIEGLGRLPGATAGQLLATLAAQKTLPVANRRKTAEALAGHPEQGETLKALLFDPDLDVRAQAAWSTGFAGGGPLAGALFTRIVDLIGDPDVDVAVNATAATALLARAAPSQPRARAALCAALSDARPYVRANALAGLALSRVRCADGQRERTLLSQDGSDIVRQTAAELLWRVPSAAGPAAEADGRSLARCVADDKSGKVVRACRESTRSGADPKPVVVFVIPDGRSSPLPSAPYALLRSDGLIRAGIADNRGAVFERYAPSGDLSLLLPAALAF
jgi:HEAT repeat protein